MGVVCLDFRAFMSGDARRLDATNSCGSARSSGASRWCGCAVDGSAIFYSCSADRAFASLGTDAHGHAALRGNGNEGVFGSKPYSDTLHHSEVLTYPMRYASLRNLP